MKRLLHLSASIPISLSVFGQKGKGKDSNIPAFGKVEKAEAVVLFDKGELLKPISPALHQNAGMMKSNELLFNYTNSFTQTCNSCPHVSRHKKILRCIDQ